MRFSSILLGFVVLLSAGCDYNAASVDYPPVVTPPPAQRSFAEGLWTVSGAPGEIDRLDATQLLESGTRTPATRFFTSSAGLFSLNTIAFDDAGVMWVASPDDSLLLGFSAPGESGSGAITPSIIIQPVAGSIATPAGMAFDSDGSLWIANFANGTIVRFDKSQLTSSGAPVPSRTITGIANPTGLAFDASGALWVSDLNLNTVSSYLRSQLLTSGNKEPAIVLGANGNLFVNPAGIAFDSFNNMWVANVSGESVTAFRPPQRAASGSPVPMTTIHPAETPLGAPAGLAFDGEGNLWVIGVQGMLSKFSIASIAGSGPAEPLLQVTVTNNTLLWSIAFFPKPVGFPLN